MIKLVVTDMDGTFVDSNKELHPETIDYIKKLLEKGVKFSIASGRQYQNLRTHFLEIEDQLIFISDNGTIIHDGLDKIYVDAIDTEKVLALINDLRKISNTDLVLCGVEGAYVEKNSPDLIREVKVYYEDLKIVDRFEDILHTDQICKVSIYDWEDAEVHSYPIVEAAGYPFSVNLSGKEWVDFMNPEASKGHAIKFIREAFDIDKDECMAFGDYLNDYTMML